MFICRPTPVGRDLLAYGCLSISLSFSLSSCSHLVPGALQAANLDFGSKSIQEFSSGCDTDPATGVVDYTQYYCMAREAKMAAKLAQSQQPEPSNQANRFASNPAVPAIRQQPKAVPPPERLPKAVVKAPNVYGAKGSTSGLQGLGLTLPNGRRVALPGLKNDDVSSSHNTQAAMGHAPLAPAQPLAPQSGLTGVAGAGDRDAVRRAFADWEAGHLGPAPFLAAIEAAGFTVTPKARQMAYVSGGATFQALMKSLTGGDEALGHLPQHAVKVTQVDPRKHGENARFVVQNRRSLDVRDMAAATQSGAQQPKSYTGSGHMPGYGGRNGAGACNTIRAEKAPAATAFFQPKGVRGEHHSNVHLEGGVVAANGNAATASAARLTKRMQAQKLAKDFTTGSIDTEMFEVGLRALGVGQGKGEEAMRLANHHHVGGGIPVHQLTRAITMQLA